MPDGFGIYFFTADASTMIVTYPVPATEQTYHVSYGDTVGSCWQALVDSHGRS
jgi:hypothetical protein